MKDLLSLIPLPWKLAGISVLVLCIGGAGVFGAWKGYGFGFEKAKALGHAALSEERADREKENTARALAVAQAERQARERVENANSRADALEQKLIAAEADHARERAALTRRINHAAKIASATCAGLPAEWVREYNSALAGSGDLPMSGNAGFLPFADTSGTVPLAVPRLSSGSPLTDPADILAHARDYGAQCRRYARQVRGWQETHDAWKGRAR